MRSRLLILCPGQGDQHAHMFDLARGDARAAALLDGLALPSFDADPALMFSNRAAQQLIVASELATWERFATTRRCRRWWQATASASWPRTAWPARWAPPTSCNWPTYARGRWTSASARIRARHWRPSPA